MRNEWKASKMSEMIQFTAQLFVDIGKRDTQIRRALQVLQGAQRHHPENAGEMEACSQGEWIAISDVLKAIQILQEEG